MPTKSKNKTTIIEGRDGRLYEFPADVLKAHEVPGERVQEIRNAMAAPAEPAGAAGAAGAAELPPGHSLPPGPSLPPGHGLPTGHSLPATENGHSSQSMNIPIAGGGVTLNFYFGRPPAGGAQESLEGYHFDFDDSGIPVNHTDMLHGEYIDKQGNPALGLHSHDPVTGNAQ